MYRKISAKAKLQRNNVLRQLNPFSLEKPQAFFDILKAPLLDCFNYSYRNGSLSGTQQEGLISLLLKQDPDGKYKDPVYLKNWRPLALKCCNANILAKCN